MNEDNMNLNELEELRKSYNLMNEKLDGQEIVTPEQIRTVTLRKVNLLKNGLRKDGAWLPFIAYPLLFILSHFIYGISDLGLLIMGLYSLLAMGLYLFLLYKISRKDYEELDLNSLMVREKRYRMTYRIFLVITYLFWNVFAFLFALEMFSAMIVISFTSIGVLYYKKILRTIRKFCMKHDL